MPDPAGLEPNPFVCQSLAAAGALTAAECDAVLELVRGTPPVAGAVTGGEAGIRDSDVRWLPRDESSEWLYGRMNAILQQLNERFWRFLSRSWHPPRLM